MFSPAAARLHQPVLQACQQPALSPSNAIEPRPPGIILLILCDAHTCKGFWGRVHGPSRLLGARGDPKQDPLRHWWPATPTAKPRSVPQAEAGKMMPLAYQPMPGPSPHLICFVLSQAITVLCSNTLPSFVLTYWLAILL